MKRATFREKWIHAMKRKGFQPGNYARVCSDHFSPEDFQPRIKLKVLKRDAVPKVVIEDRKVENPRCVLKRVELSTIMSRFSCFQCEYVASGKEHLRNHVKYAHKGVLPGAVPRRHGQSRVFKATEAANTQKSNCHLKHQNDQTLKVPLLEHKDTRWGE